VGRSCHAARPAATLLVAPREHSEEGHAWLVLWSWAHDKESICCVLILCHVCSLRHTAKSLFVMWRYVAQDKV
jgi:hypothetical protein